LGFKNGFEGTGFGLPVYLVVNVGAVCMFWGVCLGRVDWSGEKESPPSFMV